VIDALVRAGARWQFVPLVLAAATLLAGWRWARGRAWRVLVGVTAGGLAVTSIVALWAFPALRVPRPTGPSAVGTTVVQWTDPGRDEPATTAPDDHRTVVAQLWYPADADGATARARYLGRSDDEARAVTEGLAETFGVPGFLLAEARRARSPAGVDAPPAAAGSPWPVVLFSPGLGGVRTQNTAWATDLASHGYVVVALDHPYDSAAVVLEDGTVVDSAVRSTGDDVEDDRLAASWTAVRAADLRFAAARLVDGAGLPAALASRLDPDRMAVTGHSLGGAAAIQAALEDPAFDAVIDLDGFPRNAVGALTAPLLVVVAGRGTGNPANDREYEVERRRVLDVAEAPSYELVVPNAAHLTFTDAPLFLPPVRSLVGAGGRTSGVETTSAITRAFLDTTLRGRAVVPMEAELRTTGRLRVWG
jgi:predicted dienelactone hydrolase